MNVTGIFLNFRDALISLTVFFDNVNLPWKKLDAYDEWDNSVATLFDSLVVNPIIWSLSEDVQKKIKLPSYDLLLESYDDFSFIEVLSDELPSGQWIFNSFVTSKKPFDTVEVLSISDSDKLLSDSLEICSVDSVKFIFKDKTNK
ncbi:MAG: hypothetical protein KAT32_01485 [Candidatus Moranbacteria bacterium]|nr:hypothetical protein [Candidatus Moranbacteria bacterium]